VLTAVSSHPVMFGRYLEEWQLTPDGSPTITATSGLLPVRANGVPAILKVAFHAEEKRGNALMNWYAGGGAAPVLRYGGDALLLERAQNLASLADLAHAGRDDEASRIMCAVLDQLHAPRGRKLPELVPLDRWFEPLRAAADLQGGVFGAAASAASGLLANPREVAVLHGDMHHRNVLDFGRHGWLAIDPKGLIGERYFDYANILCNPDPAIAMAPRRLGTQVAVIAGAAKLDPHRLLTWVLAWAGLSAAFLIEDDSPAEDAIRFAELVAFELD
jgi:streptomycin 6-kinase